MTAAYTLTVSSKDRPGLVAAVSNTLVAQGGNIVDAHQFNDRETGLFFMRVVFETAQESGALQAAIGAMAAQNEMTWQMRANAQKHRVILMVSKSDHCLADLLYRTRIGELNMDIAAIISNHPREAMRVSVLDAIPFHHLPITKDTKPQQEAQIKKIVDEARADLVVLARYMQILSDDMAQYLSGRCINIHHSFLPSFKGAMPYHQAHRRGVKMIGATAHYVTGDLDEGPIIYQDAEKVTHADSAEDMVRKGRNIEQRVLSHAVRCHIEQRVLVNGPKTIVFAD